MLIVKGWWCYNFRINSLSLTSGPVGGGWLTQWLYLAFFNSLLMTFVGLLLLVDGTPIGVFLAGTYLAECMDQRGCG